MTSRMAVLPKHLDGLKLKFGTLNIVETGTIRNTAPEYVEGDGYSTEHIARWVKVNGGNFTSIDLYTGVSERYLREKGLLEYVRLIQTDSRKALKTLLPPLHFVLLDSDNDATLILDEFKLIEDKMVQRGLVVVDDVLMTSVSVVKGHKIVPYAREKGYDVVIQNQMAFITIRPKQP